MALSKAKPDSNAGVEATRAAMESAARLVTATAETENEGKSVLVSLRMSELERDELNAFFAKRRLRLATGIKLLTHYFVDMAGQGAYEIGKGGVIDRRKV